MPRARPSYTAAVWRTQLAVVVAVIILCSAARASTPIDAPSPDTESMGFVPEIFNSVTKLLSEKDSGKPRDDRFRARDKIEKMSSSSDGSEEDMSFFVHSPKYKKNPLVSWRRTTDFPPPRETCGENPCLNGGTCYKVDMGHQCVCMPGYVGAFCESHSHCATNPCRNGGTCYDTASSLQCVCPVTHRGEICEARSRCHPNPCINRGVCSETAEEYLCTCPNGFRGERCSQIDHCHPNPCKNGGTCAEDISSFHCICVTGYKGALCEERSECLTSPCANGGTCNEEVVGYSCSCRRGFTGITCSDHVCTPTPCMNGGRCYVEYKDAQCLCPHGFQGSRCEVINPCVNQPCQNGGTCYTTALSTTKRRTEIQLAPYKCVCSAGFGGRLCEDHICSFCHPRAICDGFRCLCKEGYEGNGHTCRLINSRCEPSPCLNGATCSDLDGAYDCQCVTGWTGNHCQVRAFCQPNPCLNGGTCLTQKHGYSCLCPADFEGSSCEDTIKHDQSRRSILFPDGFN